MSLHYDEDDLLPLSALQHLIFCERQCALIHLERQWADNRLTVEGSHMHERVHESGPRRESRGDLRIERGLHIRSLTLGIAGIADVVEFHRAKPSPAGSSSGWVPYPVEYKRGKPKPDRSDEVQLCAQALCLEEMMSLPVPAGALYYGRDRRREAVAFDTSLRDETVRAARRLHELVESGKSPPAILEPKCKQCSLIEICMPELGTRPSAAAYLKRGLSS